MKSKIWEYKEFIVAIAVVLVFLMTCSFAWLVIRKEGDKINIIRSGKLELVLDESATEGIFIENAVPVTDDTGLTYDPYTFTVKNNGKTAVRYTLYLDDYNDEDDPIADADRMADESVRYGIVKNDGQLFKDNLENTGVNPNRVLQTAVIEAGAEDSYSLWLWIDQDAGKEVMGKIFSAELRIVAEQTSKPNASKNQNIKAVYQYDAVNDSTKCITGEENTCLSINPDTYEAGTIVKYAVNDSLEKYFYVLHDDGETLTLQDRENTTESFMWYLDGDDLYQSGYGPLTILTILEGVTSSWINVNDQTYAMGTTIFQGNPYTGCSSSDGLTFSCSSNVYSLENRTVKARMITVQEATTLNCTRANQSCPVYLYNYLGSSIDNGGTVNSENSYGGYWTMNIDSASNMPWFITSSGQLASAGPTIPARAVVVINK